MNSNISKMAKIKKVDCILIFMLDEERDFFLNFNNQFILNKNDKNRFKEFTFFDKFGQLRKGVICSNGTAMGNTEACSLFYQLSREYIADLYINLGVSGLKRDVNIGDVVVVTRLSTLGEENAADAPWQLKDVPDSFSRYSESEALKIQKYLSNFSETTKISVQQFKKNLKEQNVEGLCNFDCNEIKTGWCGTVPEVIKGKDGYGQFPVLRKLNVVDMEAYYLELWHSLIKEIEPMNSVRNSKFLVFKSASDYGDDNKHIFEQCGSRELAMKNLCNVVLNYCTQIHKFPKKSNSNISSFFNNDIKNHSIDEFVDKSEDNFNNALIQFEQLCRHFIETEDINFNKEQCVISAFNAMAKSKRTIFLCGRSGTAKSTFMSYLYVLTQRSNLNAILIDFSKYNKKTVPNSSQIIYLLKKLLCTEKRIYVFLDGIDCNAPYYEDLVMLLDNDNYENISYCIGDIAREGESLDIIPHRMDKLCIEFSGENLYSEDFDEMLMDAEKYFEIFQNDFNADDVKKFVLKSEITNVDFRLLAMMFDHGKDILRSKNLYTFLKKYMMIKFSRPTLQEYRHSSFIFDTRQSSNMPIEYMKIYYNTYANSLAIAQEIVEIFQNNNIERIQSFITSRLLLSDDMNLFLQHALKNNKQSADIVDNIMNVLENSKDISISVQTQLLYNLSSIVTPETTQYNRLKKMIEKQIKVAYIHNENGEDDNYYWMIQYRTLCIILNKYFNNSENLNAYNQKLLTNTLVARCNLNFHFLYYSKCLFSFEHINKFNIEFLSNEQFLNTYYVLKHFLEDDFSNKIISNNPFVLMNIITYLNLINIVIIEKQRFLYLKKDIEIMLASMQKIISGVKSRFGVSISNINQIFDLLILTSQKLNA